MKYFLTILAVISGVAFVAMIFALATQSVTMTCSESHTEYRYMINYNDPWLGTDIETARLMAGDSKITTAERCTNWE